MSRSPLEPIFRALAPLLRSGGRGRWCALALLGLTVAAFWWRPELFLPASVETVAPADTPIVEAPDTAGRGPTTDPGDTARPTGTLRDLGQGVYQSPAGLVYTRGSQHGHRIEHVLAHGRDEPDRPGQHGVFMDSRREAILALIDEAYLQALRGERTRRQRDRERTILTVDLRRPIGYIGGQTGDRRGHPPTRYLRLVLEDDRVITAYPVVP